MNRLNTSDRSTAEFKNFTSMIKNKGLNSTTHILDKFLYLAIKNNNDFRLVFSLISIGANINYKTKGQTPLHAAITNDNPVAIIFLLYHEADTNITNNEDKLPLDLLIENQGLAEKVISRFRQLSNKKDFPQKSNEFINSLQSKIDPQVTAVTSDDLKPNEFKPSKVKASSTESDVNQTNQANNSHEPNSGPTM